MREGYKTYAELQRENEEKFKSESRKYLEQEAERIKKEGIKINTKEAFKAGIGSSWGSESRRDEILNSDFGSSKLDRQVSSVAGLENLNEFRATNQSTWDQIGNSLVNASVIAGTTILDSWGGIAVGLVSAVGAAVKGEDWAGIRAAYANNPWSSFLQNILEELSLPVYKSLLYDLASNWAKMTSSAFWTESIIKNAGFLIGAYVSGNVTGNVLSKAVKLDKALDMFKATAVSAGANKTDDALTLLKRFNAGEANITLKAVEEALLKTAKKIRNRLWGVRAASLVIASDGEARIEAIGSAKNYYEGLDNIASQMLQKNTSEEYLNKRLFDEHPEWFELQIIPPEIAGVQGIQVPKLREEYLKLADILKQQYKETAQQQYNQYSEKLKKDFKDYLNTVYTANLALLIATNGGLTKNAASGGFSKISKMSVSYGGKFGKSPAGAGAMDLAGLSGSTLLREGAKILHRPVAEAILEGTQGAITRAADAYYGDRINSFYGQILNPEGLKAQSSFLGNLASAMGETITDPAHWEEAITGFITAALPFTGGRMTKTVQNDGTVKKGFRFNSGILADIQEYIESKKNTNKYIQTYNEFANDPNKKKYVEAVLRNHYYENLKEGALVNSDKNEYKNSEYNELINMAMLFHANGRTQAFKEAIENLYSIESEQDIEDIKGVQLTDKGLSIFDGMSNQEIFDYYKNTKQDVLKTIDKVGNVYENLTQIWGNQRSEEFLQELSYNILNIDNRENRIKDITSKIVKLVNDNRKSLEKSGIDITEIEEVLDNISSLSIFFEKGQAELLDKAVRESKKLPEQVLGKKKQIESLRNEGIPESIERLDTYNTLVDEYNNLTDKESLTKEEQDRLDYLESFLEQEENVIDSEYYNRLSLTSLRSVLTRFQNQQKKSFDTIRAEKIKDIERAIDKRNKSINRAIKELSKLNKQIGNLYILEVSQQDINDLARLLAQREQFIELLNSLLENPETFEKSVFKSFTNAYNSYIENKIKGYIEEFKKSKDPRDIPFYHIDTAITQLKKEDQNNLVWILDIWKNYVDTGREISEKNKNAEDVEKPVAYVLQIIAKRLSLTTAVSKKEMVDVVKKVLEIAKKTVELQEETPENRKLGQVIDRFIKDSKYGEDAVKNKEDSKSEKKTKKRLLEANTDEEGRIIDLEEEEEDSDISEEDSQEEEKKTSDKSKETSSPKNEEDDHESAENVEEEKEKPTKVKKENIELRNDPLELPVEAITADGLSKPLTQSNSSLSEEDQYNDDEIVNTKGKSYDIGESFITQKDDKTIDAFHVGRLHTKYSIKGLQNRKKELNTNSRVSEFLEKMGAYDFVDKGGLAAVSEYYSKKNKEIPIKFMTVPQIGIPESIPKEEKNRLMGYNRTILAVAMLPKNTRKNMPKGLKPSFTSGKFDYYIIGAVSTPSKEHNKNAHENFENVRKEFWNKNSTNYRRINIDNKSKEGTWIRLSTYTSSLAWIYSGRLVTNQDENNKPVERNLKEVLSNEEKNSVDNNKPTFSIVIHKGSYKPVYIGKSIPEDKIVGLNYFREKADEGDAALTRAGTVWILHQEADGKYYHKAVKVRTFNEQYYEQEMQNSENVYMKDLIEVIGTLKEATTVEEYKESLRFLRNYLYFPNSNLYIKDGILYISKGSHSDSINIEESTVEDILKTLSKYHFKFTFNQDTTFKTVIDSNILYTDLLSLGNIGASAIVNMVDFGDKDVKILNSQTVENWKTEELIHTGETGQLSNRRTFIPFNSQNYYRDRNSDGTVTYYKNDNGYYEKIEITEENTTMLESLEFLYYKNLNYQNKNGTHVEKFISKKGNTNKYTVFALIKPFENRDPEISYFFADGTKLTEEAVKIAKKLKQAVITHGIEGTESTKEKLFKVLSSLINIYKLLHGENYDRTLSANLNSVINAFNKAFLKEDQQDFFDLILEVADALGKKYSTVANQLEEILELTGEDMINLEDLYGNTEMFLLIFQSFKEIGVESEYRKILEDIIINLPESSEFLLLSEELQFSYIRPLIGYFKSELDSSKSSEDDLDSFDTEDYQDDNTESFNENTVEDSFQEDSYNENSSSTSENLQFGNFGNNSVLSSENLLSDNMEDALDNFIEESSSSTITKIISNITTFYNNYQDISNIDLSTDNGLKEAIRILAKKENVLESNWTQFLNNLENKCR